MQEKLRRLLRELSQVECLHPRTQIPQRSRTGEARSPSSPLFTYDVCGFCHLKRSLPREVLWGLFGRAGATGVFGDGVHVGR